MGFLGDENGDEKEEGDGIWDEKEGINEDEMEGLEVRIK